VTRANTDSTLAEFLIHIHGESKDYASFKQKCAEVGADYSQRERAMRRDLPERPVWLTSSCVIELTSESSSSFSTPAPHARAADSGRLSPSATRGTSLSLLSLALVTRYTERLCPCQHSQRERAMRRDLPERPVWLTSSCVIELTSESSSYTRCRYLPRATREGC
jgi:hypothetical protein